MSDKKIMRISCGISNGGMACGPVMGDPVVELLLRDEESGEEVFHTLDCCFGTLNFWESTTGLFNACIELSDELKSYEAEDFADSSEFYEALEDGTIDASHAFLWKFMAFLAYTFEDDAEELKAAYTGKHLNAFEIPVCEPEEDYLYEKELD